MRAWCPSFPAVLFCAAGQVYDAKKGAFTELGMLDVQQIFGRAGRPQFDTSGEATIITAHSKLAHYLGERGFVWRSGRGEVCSWDMGCIFSFSVLMKAKEQATKSASLSSPRHQYMPKALRLHIATPLVSVAGRTHASLQCRIDM
eukprot:GHRQ01030218.1.p2 GENE.GHRQ01030218.1~~GHRQ01030218.1.p2  ORF type:complete len:145 (+),score=23.65 GHRQ01030218.1:253-687(+)